MAHEPGTFCTALLHTRDVESSGRFYSDVFGWGVHDEDSGAFFTLRGHCVAGISRTKDGANFWVPYVTVRSVAETRDAAVHAGASVVVVAPQERSRTLLRDPEGALFGL